MSDIEAYKEMLGHATQRFEERPVSASDEWFALPGAVTLVFLDVPEPEGYVSAQFNAASDLLALSPEGCSFDCDSCRS